MIGHNSSNNRSSLAPEKDRHGRGMNDTMQQQVLQLFKVGAWVNLLLWVSLHGFRAPHPYTS